MCYNMEKYTEKKQRNQVFQKFIKRHIGENQMDLVQDCNTFLSFVADKTLEKQKLYKANSCKNRFCPVCAWRKARKDALGWFCCKVKIICTSIQNYKSKYCFNSKEFC